MAFARLLFRVLLILLVLFVGVGLILPSTALVERRIVVNAPTEAVFPHINSMRAFHQWSPWSAIDPDTHYVFEGPEQGVGSRMVWNSDNVQVASGSQEITKSVNNESVETYLTFGEKGDGTARWYLSPQADATEVVWQFQSDFGWDLFSRYIGLMMDSMIGPSYEQGLATLKQRVENGS